MKFASFSGNWTSGIGQATIKPRPSGKPIASHTCTKVEKMHQPPNLFLQPSGTTVTGGATSKIGDSGQSLSPRLDPRRATRSPH